MSTERGDLRVNITGNSAGFTAAMNQVKQQAKALQSSWSVGSVTGGLLGGLVGAFSLSSVQSMISSTIDAAKEIKALSEQFDISTDSVQKWQKALGKAQLDENAFFRVMDRVRAAREAARNDPTKRGVFDMMGMTGDAIGHMSDEEFTVKMLRSNASRPQINAIGGRGAARVGAALPYYDQAKPVMPGPVVDQVASGRVNLKQFWQMLGVGATVPFTKQFWKDMLTVEMDGMGGLMDQRRLGKMQSTYDDKKASKEDARAADDEAAFAELTRKDAEDKAANEKMSDAKEKLREAKRKGMTSGQRRVDTQSELSELDDRIKYYEDADGALGPSEMLKLAGLKTQRANLAAEMIQRPDAITPDSLAAIGGFTASSAASNPLVTIQRDQLTTQKQILDLLNTKSTGDFNPFA